MKRYLLILPLFLSLLCGVAYTETTKRGAIKPTYNDFIYIGNVKFKTETADNENTRNQGLMHRPKIADDEAMNFVFDKEDFVAFWMKNTLMSLDMLFFDSTGHLLEIKENIPPCTTAKCTTYVSKNDNVRYVIEIAGGNAKRKGIEVGDLLKQM